MAGLLSRSEQDYIAAGCRDNCRIDGRGRNDFQHYTLWTGVVVADDAAMMDESLSSSSSPPLIRSSGSARLIGDEIHLLCSVKADLVHPSLDRPNEGTVEVYVDVLEPKSPTTTVGQSTDDWQALLRDLLVPHLVDPVLLCVQPKLYAWRLQIDLMCLQISSGGSAMLDAASHVIHAALRSTQLPHIELVPRAVVVAEMSTTTSTMTTTTAGRSRDASVEVVVDGDATRAHPPAGLPSSKDYPCIVTLTLLQTTNNSSNSSAVASSSSSVAGFRSDSYQSSWVWILDATRAEQACAKLQVHVTVGAAKDDDDDNNRILAIRQTGGGSVPINLLPQLVAAAMEGALRARQAYAIVVVQGSRSGDGTAAAAGEDGGMTTSANKMGQLPLLQGQFVLQ